MDSLFHDLRFALRGFKKHPGFTLIAVLTIALGIGMTSVIFSIVNAVLLQPLPIPSADEVVSIDRRSASGHIISVSIPTYQDWQAQTQAFSHLGAFRWASANLTGDGDAERLRSAQVTADFFNALGREPLLGRLLTAAADQPTAPKEVVLREDLWQRRFGGDQGVLGQTVRLDGDLFTIVGVLPADFVFPSRNIELWTPLGAFASRLPWTQRGSSPGLYALGRLADGVTLEQAHVEMEAITMRIAAAAGEDNPAMPRLRTLREVAVGPAETPLMILLGAVGFVLLIACANVANLLLARGEARRAEIATRLAVGASRRRVVRQMLVESLLLAALGGGLGLLTAGAGLQALLRWLPDNLPRADQVAIDPVVLAFTALLVTLTGLLFGIVPALRFSRLDLEGTLRQGARQAGGPAGLRNAMVVAEVAVAMVLLVGAGLLIKSFAALRSIDPGFRAENVLTLRLNLPPASYGEPARWDGFFDQLLASVEALPGVEHVGINNGLPLASGGSESGALPDNVELAQENMASVLYQVTSPGYFQAMGIPLLAGRGLTPDDNATAAPVTVVDETLAERFWPGESAIGKRVAFEYDMATDPPTPLWREVVGVVGHVRHYELQSPSRIELYVSYWQMPIWQERERPSMALFLRTAVPPETLIAPVREVVKGLDAELPIFDIQTMVEVLAMETAPDRYLTDVLAVFSVLALGLAALGLYGLLAWVVGERRQEIGLRLALGAQQRGILFLILGRGLRLAALGLGIGLLASLALSRVLASVLYGVTATDPLTYALVPLVLLATAGLACLLPARRAAKVEPTVALRYE